MALPIDYKTDRRKSSSASSMFEIEPRLQLEEIDENATTGKQLPLTIIQAFRQHCLSSQADQATQRVAAEIELVSHGAQAQTGEALCLGRRSCIELRQPAAGALSKGVEPDPLVEFSIICRVDLDRVGRTFL